MSFKPIQKEVDDYISQFKEGYFPPLEMLARLTEELGELARALSYHTGFKKLKSGEKADGVADELCDVIFVAVCLANSLNIVTNSQCRSDWSSEECPLWASSINPRRTSSITPRRAWEHFLNPTGPPFHYTFRRSTRLHA